MRSGPSSLYRSLDTTTAGRHLDPDRLVKVKGTKITSPLRNAVIHLVRFRPPVPGEGGGRKPLPGRALDLRQLRLEPLPGDLLNLAKEIRHRALQDGTCRVSDRSP